MSVQTPLFRTTSRSAHMNANWLFELSVLYTGITHNPAYHPATNFKLRPYDTSDSALPEA